MTITTKSPRVTKAALAAQAAEVTRKAAEVRLAEHRARVALDALVRKLARCRNLSHRETVELIEEVKAGRVIVDPSEVAREVEVLISTSLLHEGCKGSVREYGSPTYRNNRAIGTHRCVGCSLPLDCGGVARNHEYVTLTAAECLAKGIYRAGNCFHVSRCKHCGDIASVDSSD